MSQSQNQIQVTNISGGGSPPTPISRNLTYQQLLANISGSTLVTGETITITDFQIITYIQNSGAIGSEVIHYGSIEPMVARAISPNQLAPEIVSTVNPTDIIYYEPIFADREYDAVNSGGITSTGVITFRQDIKGNARNYDWRNIVFRRWETAAGSGVFDSITDTGFSFQDFAPFNAATSFNHFVGSPLAFSAAYSIPYWLDNVVGVNFTAVNTVGLGYGCTVQGTFGNNKIGSMLYVNCLADFSANTITNMNGLQFSANCIGNYGESWTSSTVGGVCQVNNILQFNINTISGTVSNNVCRNVQNNICSGAITGSGSINNNVVNVILNNNLTDCNYNTGNQIDSNSNGAIINNDCFSIFNNNMLTNTSSSSIDGNICETISGNTIEWIHLNVMNLIQNNNATGTGSGTEIAGNIGGNISENTMDDGTLITYNNVTYSINNNSINLGIYYNRFFQCQFNTNVEITNNIGQYIEYNTVLLIDSNSVGIISNNSGGTIQYNQGLSIQVITNFTNIKYNNLTYINSSNIGGFELSGNLGYGFTNITNTGGDITGCNNVSLDTCTINTRGIKANNFLTGINVYTFSPTVNMAASTPSITTFDTTNGQVEQVLTAGVLTYTPF